MKKGGEAMKVSKCCKAKVAEHAQIIVRAICPKLNLPNYFPEGKPYPFYCTACRKPCEVIDLPDKEVRNEKVK